MDGVRFLLCSTDDVMVVLSQYADDDVYLAVREFVLGQHRGARKHFVADVALLTAGRHYVRRLHVSLQLALGLERLCAVDAVLLVFLASRRHRHCCRCSRQFVGCGGSG